MKKVMLVGFASLVVCLGMHDPKAVDKEAIERAVLNYVEGVYEVNPEMLKQSVHPELTKVGYYRRDDDQRWRTIPMTFEQLVQLAGDYNVDGHIPSDAPKKVKVLDLLDKTASAKLTAEWGIDYLHLAKLDGTWTIMHVIWQSPPSPAHH